MELTSTPSMTTSGTTTGTMGDRIAWAILGLIPTIVFGVALSLSPDPSGYGTHQQLGLPPCGFYYMTGYPCPGCGLTTCFTHMVRFQWISATHANPFGVLLFLVSFCTIITSIVGFIKKLPVLATLERLHFEKWAVLMCISSITVWAVRMITLYFHL